MTGVLQQIEAIPGRGRDVAYRLKLDSGVEIRMPFGYILGQFMVGDAISITPFEYEQNGKRVVASRARDITVTRDDKKVSNSALARTGLL